MISLLQPLPAAELEPGDLLHHPRVGAPTRVLWVRRTDEGISVLTAAEPSLTWVALPSSGAVMVNERVTDCPTRRLLAAVRGAQALVAAGAGDVQDGHVRVLTDALTARVGRHPSLRAIVHQALQADAAWASARSAV